MSNLTDALIAAKLVGGSGGSGGGSGLPEISRTESTVLETQTITFTIDGDNAHADLSIDGLEVGREYSVIYDGVTYSGLIAKKDDYDDIYIGNLAIWGEGFDTGEPFLIVTYKGETSIDVNNTTPSHSIGITAVIYNPDTGSVLVSVDGEWKAQAGYGFERNGEFIPISPSLLPAPVFMLNLVEDSDAASGYALDKTPGEIQKAWQVGSTIILHAYKPGSGDEVFYRVFSWPGGSDGTISGMEISITGDGQGDLKLHVSGVAIETTYDDYTLPIIVERVEFMNRFW